MNTYPPVSIYIVTYMADEERGAVLRRTVEAALAQDYPEFEVVVSDNAGAYPATDALAAIDDPRLRVCLNQENAGFTGNMNRCTEHCRYDIIKPLCDDDLIHSRFLHHTVPLVDEKTLVMGRVEKFPFGTEPDGLTATFSDEATIRYWDAGYTSGIWTQDYSSSCIPSAVLYSRGLFELMGGYDDQTITSDWDFFIEACIHAKVAYVERTLCFVGVWPGSLTERMMETPYFYPQEALYTEFRVWHCKKLGATRWVGLLFMLLRHFLWQSLRPLRHPFQANYRAGYAKYASRFFGLLFMHKNTFPDRPLNP